MLCCHVAVRSYAGMLAIRFILSMFEAGIRPETTNIVTMFHTRDERLLRIAIEVFNLVLVPLYGLAGTYIRNSRSLLLMLNCLPPLAGLLGIKLI